MNYVVRQGGTSFSPCFHHTSGDILLAEGKGGPQSSRGEGGLSYPLPRGARRCAYDFLPINVGAELVQAGKVRALAVATATRNPTMKDTPTIGEAALPGFKYDSGVGLRAPAGTPREIIAKVNRDVAEILKTDDIKAKFAAQGVEAMALAPDAFDAIIAADTAKLADMFKDGVK